MVLARSYHGRLLEQERIGVILELQFHLSLNLSFTARNRSALTQ
jgi:hypothetical protein